MSFGAGKSLEEAFSALVYGDGAVAVRDFSLHVESREATSLAGTSGSDKTTVLRMVNRMVEPTGGKAFWAGRLAETSRLRAARFAWNDG